jgi:xylulokinase
VLAPGAGDNAGAALGVAARPGEVIVSVGTSGTVFCVAERSIADPSGAIAGFADATGRFLPLVCTVNAARVLEATAALLGVDMVELDRLALSAPAGAAGLTLVPYFEGERTPNRPGATASLLGMTLGNSTPACVARAAVEGMLCGLADGLDALAAVEGEFTRVILIGGGARSQAVRRIAPAIFGRPVVVPEPGEYVADGAASQAAWVLRSGHDERSWPPEWPPRPTEVFEAEPFEEARRRYAERRDQAAGGLQSDTDPP